jgi:hypothetical protein
MRKLLLLLCFVLLASFGSARGIKVLVVTGGHDFDRTSFFEMFDSMKRIEWTEAIQPEANQMMVDGRIEDFHVIVFYDMFQEISDEEQAAFLDLLAKGKPMLFMHHALVSYQNWDKFKFIVGGKYYDKEKFDGVPEKGYSTYLHDTEVPVQIIPDKHPVTKGLSDFTLFDEVYGNTEVLPTVHPLLGTDHPQSSGIIGWENECVSSRIIYLQPGHGKESFQDKNFRKLLQQSILYLSTF